ncbi:anaphase-promoting complex subunit 4-like [Eucalyptus grandis]|uniref:anaphase-promoting complex subunit 4-like n=1 Tax=Eucalyptus grandis TaxID=71139 RepID=UPI00192E8065|nr:anaphase-promoting complex subunit 4-like [Eucalyptus grandis]
MHLLDLSEADEETTIDPQTMQGVGELLQFGGFGGHRIFAKDTCERISIDGTQDDFEFASDYISFQIPEESFLDVTNHIAVVSGLKNVSSNVKKGRSLEGSCCASLLVTVVWIRLYLRTTYANNRDLYQLKDSILHLDMENEKIRSIPHNVVPPLSVSASRGVACVLAARKRALVYILDEDEDEISDSE